MSEPSPPVRRPWTARARSVVVRATEMEPRRLRTRIAVLMAVVSLSSAYVTYVATERGSEAGGLDGLASQQAAEEQQVEQQNDAIVAQERRLTTVVDEHLQRYRQQAELARSLRTADPVRAAENDLAAQTSWEHLRQLLPFFRGSVPDLTGASATYDADAARASLRVQDWHLYRASSVLTRADAALARDVAGAMVLVIVLLVGALFLLTVAHILGGRVGVGIASVGFLVVVGAAAWFAAIDPAAARPLLVAALLGVSVALVVRRVARDRPLLAGMDDPDAALDIASLPSRPGSAASVDPAQAPITSFTRLVALALASVTLCGAYIGYLQGSAAAQAETAAWRARDLGVEAIGTLRAAEEELTVATETYELALRQRIDGWGERQAADYWTAAGDAGRAARGRTDAADLATLADSTEARSGIGAELGSRGVSEELQLRRVRARVWEPAALLAARQDAANAEAAGWGDRAAIYVSILTWLAVAAYLLGLALVFREERLRRLMAIVAAILIVASLGRTIAVAGLGPSLTAEQETRSSEAYAAGFAALSRNEPLDAVASFDVAIDLRPDFGIARRDRAQAILEAGNGEGVGVHSVFSPESVTQAIGDLTSARESGTETAGVLLNLGAMLFHRSIQTGSDADMAESVDLTRLGLERGYQFGERYGRPHINEVVGRANLGLALVGSGRFDEAEVAYREMAAATQRLPRHWQPALVGAALTTLEILAASAEAPTGSALAAMKEIVIADTYGASASGSAQLGAVSAEVFPSILQWRASMPGFDPASDRLVTQWYRHDAATDGWSGLPLVSGPLTLDVLDVGGQFHRDTGDDAYWGNSGALLRDVPATCVEPGRYRVELYLNGRLAGSAESVGTQRSVAALARDVGYAMCHPPTWVPAAIDGGFSGGVTSPDGSRGLVVFRLHQPIADDGSDGRLLAMERLVAAMPPGVPRDLGAGTPLDPATQPTVFGRKDGVWRSYTDGDGTARMNANWAADGTGTVLAICLYGPADWIDSAEAQALVLSLIEH